MSEVIVKHSEKIFKIKTSDNLWWSSVLPFAQTSGRDGFVFRVSKRTWNFIRKASRRPVFTSQYLANRLVYKTRRRLRRMIASQSRHKRASSKAALVNTRPTKPAVATLGLMALEPRIVFDAAVAVTADVAADQVAQQQADSAVASGQPTATNSFDTDSFESSFADFIGNFDADATFENVVETQREIAFIDGSVEGVANLIAELPSSVEVFVLNASRDGVEQIADVLNGRTDIDAIHILSHGSQGSLSLGSATLNSATMQAEYLDELTVIGQALTTDGDILIYGCDFTAGEKGLQAAMILGGITGADIAASNDMTGSADLGGDWDLETSVGIIDVASVSATEWSGLLAAPVANADGPISMVGGVVRNIDVLANDTDADGNTLTITGIKDQAYPNAAAISISTGQTVTLATGTTIKLNADNTLAVTMHPDVTSQEVFQYVISDGAGGTATGNVTIIRDTDGDGVMDSIDTDDDNDGISDVREGLSTSRMDFAVADGFTALAGQTVTQTYATSNPDITFDLTLQADVGNVSVLGVNASFASRTTDGDTSGIVIYPSGITSTTQHNSITIKFSDTVQNVSFTYADIDGGNGISDETTTFIAKLNGVTRVLTPSEVQALVDTPPTQDGNTFVGTGAGSSNAIRITFKEKIDELQIINGITSNNLNTSNSQTLFDLTFEHEKPGDTDGDGIADHLDIDSDNDGITDTNETINTDGLSAATAFQDLGMAGTVSTPGVYYFNIDGQAFSTYVDANGYVLAAIDFGDGTGALPQSTSLTNLSRGILTPAALSSLDGATEIRISSSNGVVDATSKDVDLIARVASNTTLKYEGTSDNFMNDFWTGTGSQYLTADGLVSTLGGNLNENIFHASGNTASLMWAPVANYQRTIYLSGEISSSEALYLWVKAPQSPTRVDVNNDADVYANRVDIDSDNDGITDNVEAQTTAGYIAPSGMPGAGFTDADHDGLDDNYDANVSLFSQTTSVGLTPVDTDSDGKADYIDTDSDNDGILDIVERGDGGPKSITSLTDTDHDGLLDIFEAGTVNDGFDVNDSNRTATTLNLAADPLLLANGSNATPLIKDALFRDADTDNDGVIDSIDIDDDNDGIIDVNENGTEKLLVSWPNTLGSTAPIIQSSTQVQSADNLVAGSGVTTTLFAPSSIDVLNVDAQSLAEAYINNEYVQYGFTVTALADTLSKIRFARNGTAGEYHIGALISDDGFATSTTLIDDFTAPTVTEYQRFEMNVGPYQLLPGVNYQVRIYFFNAAGGRVQDFDDFALSGGEYDADNDGRIDRLDIDSDNDGITDNVEAQTTAAYIAPTGNGVIADTNMNGLDDVYEVAAGTAGFNADGIGLAPVDTDNDGIKDYKDTDSDNDGILDVVERGDGQATTITSTIDSDDDGLYDIFESGSLLDGFDVNDQNLDVTGTNFNIAGVPALNADGSNAVPLTTDLYFRDVNNAPVDGNETNTATEDTTLTVTDGSAGDLLANATDVDGDTLTISGYTVAGVTGTPTIGSAFTIPNVGDITINADGSYSFVPAANFNGTVPLITYTVSDGNNGTNTSTLSLSVSAINDAPTSTAISGQSGADADTVSLDVSGNFTDADTTDTLTYSATGLPAGLSINASTGVISGTIDNSASQSGPYSVSVTATDGSNAQTTQTFTWTITNPAPAAKADDLATTENTAISGSVLSDNGNGADADPDGDALSVSLVDGAAGNVGTAVAGSNGGSFTIAANGTYNFAPGTDFDDLAAGETRTTAVTYTITDGEGGSSQATVTVTVTGVNDAPASTAISGQSGADDDTVSLDVSGNFTDADTTDTLTYSATGLPAGLSINASTGVISGTIDNSASQSGPYSVSVTATDGSNAQTTQTFTWTITNPAPAAQAANFSVSENEILNGTVVARDPDGDRLTYSGPLSQPSHGDVVVKPDGSFSYVPHYGFAGNDVFEALVDDGEGGTTRIIVNINVVATETFVPLPEEPKDVTTSTDDGPKMLVVDGIILDTVDDISPLGDNPINLNVPGIVIDSVNAIKRLDSFSVRSGNEAMTGSVINSVADFDRLLQSARSVYPDFGTSWDAQSQVGYSVRMDVTEGVQSTDRVSGEQIIVETLVRNRTMYVQISNTIHGLAGDRLIGYRVLQSDGSPVPSWVNIAAEGQLLIEPPIDGVELGLKIVARLSDGSSISKFVDIETATGEVHESTTQVRATAPMFLQQLRLQAN